MDTQSFKNALFQSYSNKSNIFISNKPKLQVHILLVIIVFPEKSIPLTFYCSYMYLTRNQIDLQSRLSSLQKSLSLVE